MQGRLYLQGESRTFLKNISKHPHCMTSYPTQHKSLFKVCICNKYLQKRIKPTLVTGRGRSYFFETSTVPRFLDNRLTDGGEFVSPMRQPPFTPPGRFPVFVSVRGCVDFRTTVRLDGLGQLKNPMSHW
jgi:hypothetical protein